MSDAVDNAVDKAEIEAFPKPTRREICDRVNDVAIVEFVEAPFFFEYLWYLAKRSLQKQGKADDDADRGHHDR